MAIGIIWPPGDTFGPCEKSCDHEDCAKMRKMAEEICPYCRVAIGYAREYASVKDYGACHLSCRTDAVAKGYI